MTRRMHPPELERPRERDRFDPVVEGARYGLSRELSLAIWERVCADATDSAGRRDMEQARQRFHDLAARMAARGVRLRPDVGRVTRVDVEIAGDSFGTWSTNELRPRTPGRQTLVEVEARRWMVQGERPMADEASMVAPKDAHGEMARRELSGVREVTRALAALQPPPRPDHAIPLDTSVGARLSQLFGVDLTGVAVVPASSAATGSTKAVTKDGAVHFRAGTYQPGTRDGDWLIAHELTHVVQQQSGHGKRTGSRKELEREADRAATQALLGYVAPIALRAQPGAAYAFSDDEEHEEELSETGESDADKLGTGSDANKLQATGRGDDEQPAHTVRSGGGAEQAPGSRQQAPSAASPLLTHTTQNPAMEGDGDQRTVVGVGERVNFASDRSGTWTATAGLRDSTHGRGTRFRWYAPATAGNVTVTFDPGHGGARQTFDMRVIAPSGVDFILPSAKTFPAGTMGAGMITQVRFLPFTVDFSATSWKEVPGPASNASGYFAGRRLPYHHPTRRWLPIGIGNGGPTDDASFWGFPAPWTAGRFEWSIPNKYRVDGESGDGHEFTTVIQSCTLEGDPNAGRTTVQKGTASVSRAPGTAPARSHRGRARGKGLGEPGGHANPDVPSAEAAEDSVEQALLDVLGHGLGKARASGESSDELDTSTGGYGRGEAKDRPVPEVSLPDDVNMSIASDGTIIARKEWVLSDPGLKRNGNAVLAPSRNAEILRALKSSGVISWIEDGRIPEFSKKLVMQTKLKQKFLRLGIAASVFAVFGPPPGSTALVIRDGKGLIAIFRTSAAIPGGAKKDQLVQLTRDIRDKLWTAVEQFTKMPFELGIKSGLADNDESYKPLVHAGDDGIQIPIASETLERLYGKKQWTEYLANPQKDSGAGGGVVTAGGVQFIESIPEEDRKYFLAWMKQLGKAGGTPSDATITPSVIAKMREIDKRSDRDKILEELKAPGTGGKAQVIGAQYLDNVINAVKTEKAKVDLGLKESGGTSYKALFDESVRGNIMNRGGLLHVGEDTQFYFETANNRDAFAVPHLYVKWLLVKKDQPETHLKEANTHHIDISGKKPDTFSFTWKDTGIYTVHAFVTHTFYLPSHFQIDVEVKTEAQRTKELNDPAFAELKGGTTYETGPTGWPFDVSWFNTLFGSKKQEYGKKSWGSTPDDFKRLSYEDRVKFLGADKKRLEDMIKAHTKGGTLTGEPTDARWRDMVSYAKDKLKELEETQGVLDKDKASGHTFFEARGTFLSRKNGIPDTALKLVASANKDKGSIKTIVHDFTQLYEPLNYKFSASGTTFEKSIEATFVDLAKSYPPGRISCLFEALDDNAQPQNKTVGFELDTGTAWKDVKSVVYNEYVMLAVNIVGAATMVFLPVTAPVLFPVLGVYNSIDTIDNMAQLKAKGALTWQNVGTGVAQIGLNFLPYVGEMKVVAQFGKVAVYTLEGATIASMAAIMTVEGLEQIKRLRNQDISEVARLDEEVRELERTNPSDPRLATKRAELDKKIKGTQNEAQRVFQQMAKSGAIMLAQLGALKGMQKHMAAKSVSAMKSEGMFTHVAGVEPHYDPKTGMIKGDEAKLAKLDPDKVAKLKEAYVLDTAVKQSELANVLGTENVEITRGGDKVTVTKEGEGYKVQIPENKSIADALDEAWKVRKATDPKAPADRPPPIVAEVKATLNPVEVVSGHNVAVGTRVQTASEAHNILGKLAKGDRSAFKALGMEAPPREFDLRSIEWGIGQMPDGSFVIIRGEPGVVNWAGFAGVRPVAHSHPLNAGKLLKGGDVTFHELVKGGGANELNKVNVFPSAADVSFCVKNGLAEHTVQTPYVSKGGGRIGNPTPGTSEPLIQIKIVQPERVGSWAGNGEIGVYKSKMVATDASGKVLWTGEVHTIDHPSIGSLVMFNEPPASLMTKPVAGRPLPKSTMTPSGTGSKPIPPDDHIRIHQAAEDHANRELGEFEVTTEAQERVKAAARDAGEKAYQEAIGHKVDPVKARKKASDATKTATKTTARAEGEAAAKVKAEEKISSGDVFDMTKMAPEAKKQLENFNLGTSAADAKRLSPQLEGKTLPEMEKLLDAEVAAGSTKKTVQPIPDPTTKGASQNQLVYEFRDGTVIRVKPKGDKFNPGDVTYSVEAKQVPPGDAKPGQAGIAFKVDNKGRPVPKGPEEIKNPYNHGTNQKQNVLFEQTVLNAGHRKGTP